MSTDSRDRLLAALDGATVEDLEELASHAEAMQQLRDAKLAGRLPENQTDAMAAMAKVAARMSTVERRLIISACLIFLTPSDRAALVRLITEEFDDVRSRA